MADPIARGSSHAPFSGKDSYENLETQMISSTIQVAPANLDGTTQRWNDEQPYRVPNSAGLDRGEVAELVAYQIQAHDIWFEASGMNEFPGVVKYEIFGGTVGDLPDNVLRNSQNVADDAASGANLQVTDREILDGVIFTSAATATAGYDDDVRGVSGSGSYDGADQGPLVNFREAFGFGPLMLRDDRWWHEMELLSYGNDIHGVEGKAVYQLYWDIHEFSDVAELMDV